MMRLAFAVVFLTASARFAEANFCQAPTRGILSASLTGEVDEIMGTFDGGHCAAGGERGVGGDSGDAGRIYRARLPARCARLQQAHTQRRVPICRKTKSE